MNDVNLNLLLKLHHHSRCQSDPVPGSSMLTEAQFQRKIHFPSLPHTELGIQTKDGRKVPPKTRIFYGISRYNLSCELAEISGYLI